METFRERGIKVEYELKEEEGHGFMKEENRLELYRAMERFLAMPGPWFRYTIDDNALGYCGRNAGLSYAL